MRQLKPIQVREIIILLSGAVIVAVVGITSLWGPFFLIPNPTRLDRIFLLLLSLITLAVIAKRAIDALCGKREGDAENVGDPARRVKSREAIRSIVLLCAVVLAAFVVLFLFLFHSVLP